MNLKFWSRQKKEPIEKPIEKPIEESKVEQAEKIRLVLNYLEENRKYTLEISRDYITEEEREKILDDFTATANKYKDILNTAKDEEFVYLDDSLVIRKRDFLQSYIIG
jgi:adenine/guanine phosphoribosyltransferase-like PRPP-binding protein